MRTRDLEWRKPIVESSTIERVSQEIYRKGVTNDIRWKVYDCGSGEYFIEGVNHGSGVYIMEIPPESNRYLDALELECVLMSDFSLSPNPLFTGKGNSYVAHTIEDLGP